ncbi:MAG: variant leucine-rich repeat-containing protein, partial [Propionibacteriaceae bacterium]
MPVTAEQLALAADPGTDAPTLAALAHAEPELWPTIAAHPNADPELVEWIRQNRLPDSTASAGTGSGASQAQTEPGAPATGSAAIELHSLAAGPTSDVTGSPTPETSSLARTPALSSPSWLDRMSRRTKLTTGAGVLAAIVAIVLVATLVVAPHERASRAVEQARSAAVTDFSNAVAACKTVNAGLSAAQEKAKSAAATDPGTLKDPTLIAKLNAAVTAAQAATPCTVPTQGGDTATIQHQADDLKTAISPVHSAENALNDAVAAVIGSVQAKKDEAAAAAKAATDAAAAAAAAAQQAKDALAAAARTWHFKSNDGFTFDVALQIGAPVTDDSFTYAPAGASTCSNAGLPGQVQCETAKLAAICTDFDASRMIAIPVTA